MEELKLLLDIITNDPWGSGLKTIIGIFFIVFFNKLKSKTFREVVYRGVKSAFQYLRGNGLFAHYLFYDYRYYLHDAKKIKFECKTKSKAFRILITQKINVVMTEVKVWLRKNKRTYKSWDTIKFSNEFETLLHSTRKKFEKILLDKYIVEFGNQEGRKIYDIIMNGERGFRKFHYQNSSVMDSFLENIFMHESLPNTKLIYKFLGILDTVLAVTVDDLYKAFYELNGGLCKGTEE